MWSACKKFNFVDSRTPVWFCLSNGLFGDSTLHQASVLEISCFTLENIICSACGLQNSRIAPNSSHVNLQLPASLQVLNLAGVV